MLWVREEGSEEEWEPWAEARGEVALPINYMVRLEVEEGKALTLLAPFEKPRASEIF